MVGLGHTYAEINIALEFPNRLVTDPLIDDEIITSIIEASEAYTPHSRVCSYNIALFHILNDITYWKRLWILQDVLLASNTIVLCLGRDRLAWETISLGIARLWDYLGNVSRKPELKGLGNDCDLRTAVVHGTAASLHDIRLGLKSGKPFVSFSTQRDGATNVVRSVLGLAQLAKCSKIEDKILRSSWKTGIDMPVNYEKDLFEIYSEALQYFCKPFRILESDPCELYTARLSQIFQHLLKGPLIPKNLDLAIPCMRMSGILWGKIIQIEDGPKTFYQTSDGHAGYSMYFLNQ